MEIYRKSSRRTAGDTLVEVLLSTVVLSIVLAGAYTLSSRATRINQAAFERTQVSNYIQQQAELLRNFRDTQNIDTTWEDIKAKATPTVPAVDCSTLDLVAIGASHPDAFVLDSAGVNNFAGSLPFGGTGAYWVEALDVNDSYLDFTVSACWEAIGAGGQQQSGLVLRLEKNIYDN